MNTIFTDLEQIEPVLAPSADLFNGDPASAKVNTRLCDHVTFTLHKGAGAVGTARVTVLAYKADGSDPQPIGFYYRSKAAGAAWSDLTEVAAADAATGFVTTAGAGQLYAIEVQGRHHVAEHPLVALKLTEVINDPVLGAVEAICTRLRYTGTAMPVLYVA